MPERSLADRVQEYVDISRMTVQGLEDFFALVEAGPPLSQVELDSVRDLRKSAEVLTTVLDDLEKLLRGEELPIQVGIVEVGPRS
jgi:hypothetical protein